MYKFLAKVRFIIPLSLLILALLSPLAQLLRTLKVDPHPYSHIQSSIHESLNSFLQAHPSFDNVLVQISGGPYAIRIGDLHIMEPLSAFVQTLHQITAGNPSIVLWVSLSLSLLIIVLFGRIYCALVCPQAIISNLVLKFSPRRSNLSSGAKSYKLPAFALLLFLFLLLPELMHLIHPAAMLQHGFREIVFDFGMNFYLFSFLILLTVELGLPGFFCRSVCPTGLFLSLASRFSIFKLGYRKGTGCEKSCKSCNQVCWLGVEPKLKLSSPECDLCMRCVSVCPTNRLKPVMKNSLIGAISLFVLISPTIHTYTSTLLQDEDRTIMENRLNLRISKKDYRIHWSVLASNMRRTTPGKAVLVIYFYKPSYRSKLDIRILSDKSLVKSCEIQEPNHPGSVARNSAYSCEFDFSPKQKYSVGIKLNSSEEARFKIRYQP